MLPGTFCPRLINARLLPAATFIPFGRRSLAFIIVIDLSLESCHSYLDQKASISGINDLQLCGSGCLTDCQGSSKICHSGAA